MAAGGGGEFILRLVSMAILARMLAPESFGLVGMVMALTAIAGQFGQLGLSTVTVQRREINEGEVTNLFWINVTFGAILTASFCAFSPLVSAFYGDARLVPITVAISTTLLLGGLMVQHEALLIRQMKQAQLAFVRLTATFLSVCLAVVLAIGKYGYWALVWQEVARILLTTVGIWAFCSWRPGFPHRNESVRSLLWFGGDLTLTQVFCAVISNVDRILVGRYFGASPLGMYRQAQQLIIAPIDQLIAPVGNVMQPTLSIIQDDAARYRRYYQKVVFLIGLVTMPIAAFAAVYAEEITLVVLGDQWIEAAPFIRIFAIAAFVRPVLGTAGTVMITCGHSRRLLVVTLVSQLTLLLFIFGGIHWGAEGIAMAYVATASVLFVPNLYYSFRGTPVSLSTFLHGIRTPLIASAIMTAGLILLRNFVVERGSILSLCSGCGVGGALYLASCLLAPGGRAELRALLADIAASLLRGRARIAV